MSNVQGKKIYIALPYTYNDPYIREVRYRIATSVAASLMQKGAIVFSPISYGHQFSQYGIESDFNAWSALDYSMISWADELWLLEIDGYHNSFGVQSELSYAMQCGKNIVRLSEDDLINFYPATSLHNTPLKVVSPAICQHIAEVHYEFTVKSKFKYGDTIFIIDDNNEIIEQEVEEIAIAFIQGNQTISYNGFHSKLLFASYDAAKRALGAVCV